MVSSELYFEKLLCKDAAKIAIDEEFKSDLKNRIMAGEKNINVTEFPKRKNNFKQSKYFKIASGFVICVFVSGSIFKAIDVQTKNMFAKGKGQPEVTTPISGAKTPQDYIARTSEVSPKGSVQNSPDVDKLLSIGKGSKGSAVVSDSEKDTKVNSAVTNKDSGKAVVDVAINTPGKTVVKPSVTPVVPTPTKVPNVPKMENMKDDVTSNMNLYDSSYSVDKTSLANVKPDGIYVTDVESSTEKKVVSYNDKTQIVDKPNLTPNDGIIYYKAQKVTLQSGNIGQENGAIYLTDKSGKEIKLVDGESPMLSKDGKNLVYEYKGKIYILTLATNDKRFVDNGNNPAFSDNGKTISYVKEDKETLNYDENTGKKDVYIKKTFSSLCVFDLATENTQSLTNKEVNININNIKSWADAVKSGTVTTDLNVTSKYSYFESIWSSDNKEIYVIRKNNDEQIFELIKVNTGK